MKHSTKKLEHLIKYLLIPEKKVLTFKDAIKLTGDNEILTAINSHQEFRVKYSPFIVKDLPNGILWIPTTGPKYENALEVLTNTGINVGSSSDLNIDINSIEKPKKDHNKLLERHVDKIFIDSKYKFNLESFGYKLPLPQFEHLFYTNVEKSTGKQEVGISPELGIHLDKPIANVLIADGKYSKSDHFFELLVKSNDSLELSEVLAVHTKIAKSKLDDRDKYKDDEHRFKLMDNKIRQTVITINQKQEPLIRCLEEEFGSSVFSYAKKSDSKNKYNFIIIENQKFSFNYPTNCFSRFLLQSDSYCHQNHHQNLAY